ncbi:unnamed protein product [Closterium sp. Naga37s-1]|nr:unnamed protein product [Closterium sp. Naga37s-1]
MLHITQKIAGAFFTASLLQPQALSCFSTPAMGCRAVLLGAEGDGGGVVDGGSGGGARVVDPGEWRKGGGSGDGGLEGGDWLMGECALMPRMLGASWKLLKTDHYRVYFEGMPEFHGQVPFNLPRCLPASIALAHVGHTWTLFLLVCSHHPMPHHPMLPPPHAPSSHSPSPHLPTISRPRHHNPTTRPPCFPQRLRRHGDAVEWGAGGYWRAHGRTDDTMNLGGVKVGLRVARWGCGWQGGAAGGKVGLWVARWGCGWQGGAVGGKVGSVEVERVCNTAHPAVSETAAIGVAPRGGGPEELVVVAVMRRGGRVGERGERSEGENGAEERVVSEDDLRKVFSAALQAHLNPLFKVAAVWVVPSLPCNASNKVMRRVLRDLFTHRHRTMPATTPPTRGLVGIAGRATSRL